MKKCILLALFLFLAPAAIAQGPVQPAQWVKTTVSPSFTSGLVAITSTAGIVY